MSVSTEVIAEVRSDTGKGASRRLRREGKVPGIVYGGRQDPLMISLAHNELVKHLDHEAFYSSILSLKVGDKTEQVVLKDLQRHPAKPFIQHIDFQRIMAKEKIRMQVPLHFINEDICPGVKSGGNVAHTVNEIEVLCLPGNLPEYIDIEMSEMDVGDSVHLSEIKLPEGVELAHAPDPDLPVVTVHGAHAAEEEEEGEGAVEEGGEESTE